jgi:hypothetical protein
VKNGTVMQAQGGSIIVRTDDGIKMFTQSDIDKRGVKIMREGKPATISDFRANDRLTATIITTKPPRVMTEREVQATLARNESTPATAAPAAASTPSAAAPSQPVATTSSAAPRTLPKTASALPIVRLAGLVSLGAALALTLRRRTIR